MTTMTTSARPPGTRRGLLLVLAVVTCLAACQPTATSSRPTPSSSDAAPSSSAAASTPPPTTSPTTSPAGASPTPPPDRATATATTTNLFDTQRSFRLELTAAPDERLETTTIALDSPWYEPVPVQERSLSLSPGAQRLVPLAYGPATCSSGSPDVGDPLGDVVLTTTDGVRRVPLDQRPATLVPGRHARECAVAAVQAGLDLSFGDDWAVTGPRTVTGSLVVTPTASGAAAGGQAATVVAVAGNVVFSMTSPDLPASIDDAGTDVPVRVSASRCDTHALIEAKRKLVLPVEVALGDAPPVEVEVEADGPAAVVFQGLLEACLDDQPTGS